jgi:hypothetical protein
MSRPPRACALLLRRALLSLLLNVVFSRKE